MEIENKGLKLNLKFLWSWNLNYNAWGKEEIDFLDLFSMTERLSFDQAPMIYPCIKKL